MVGQLHKSMALSKVSKSSALPISVQDVKAQIRIELDDTTQDAYLTDLIKTALEYCENETGRDYTETTWDEILEGFPGSDGRICLPRSPVKSVTSITYFDTNGDSQTVDSADYILIKPTTLPGFLEPAPSKVWPSSQCRPNAVTVRFVTGYTTVPETLRHCIRLLVGTYHENRESELPMKTYELSMGLQRLTDQLRMVAYV